MPTITVRVTGDERARIEARASAAGQDISEYVREALRLREAHPDLTETIGTLIERSNHAIVVASTVEEHGRRLSQLERIAGMD